MHLESDRNRFGNPPDSNKIRRALAGFKPLSSKRAAVSEFRIILLRSSAKGERLRMAGSLRLRRRPARRRGMDSTSREWFCRRRVARQIKERLLNYGIGRGFCRFSNRVSARRLDLRRAAISVRASADGRFLHDHSASFLASRVVIRSFATSISFTSDVIAKV
jgi:hypothetical protein